MKTCLLFVTGSIAAVKVPELVRALQAKDFDVHCVLTKAARAFVTPRSLAAISNNAVLENEWWNEKHMKPGVLAEPEYEHLDFAKKADLLLVAPATADTLSRLSSGRASGLFEATALASRAPLCIAPAMNTQMLLAEKTQKNIQELEKNNAEILPTKKGILACGDQGMGKMLDVEIIALYAKKAVTPQKLQGKKVLVTLGATQEMLDPVRCITNVSSGKMGYAIAVNAFLQGAEVIVIAGKNELSEIELKGVSIKKIISGEEMLHETEKEIENCDYAFFVAAVCDFAPENFSQKKLDSGKEGVIFSCIKTLDIAAEMGKKKKKNQQFFGFALQTGSQKEAEEAARKKMEKKNLDGIFLNTPSNLGAESGELFFIQKKKEAQKISGTKMEMAKGICEIFLKNS